MVEIQSHDLIGCRHVDHGWNHGDHVDRESYEQVNSPDIFISHKDTPIMITRSLSTLCFQTITDVE